MIESVIKYLSRSGWLILLAFFICGARAASQADIQPDVEMAHALLLHAGDEKPVNLKIGQTLIVEMTSNPSTGYRWDATQLTRERRCFLLKEIDIESSRTPTEGKPLAGVPVKQRWTLRHDPEFPCPTEQRITWTYRRSWEPFNHSDQQASVLLQGLSKP